MVKKTTSKKADKPATKSAKKSKTTSAKTKKAKVTTKKVFVEIPEGSYFILVNGERLKHYVDLGDRLETLEKYVIDHHITPFRHDFSKWIDDVFKEHELAEKISKLKDPEKIRSAIYKHIIKKHLR